MTVTSATLGGGRGWLDAAAAASIHRIDAALGHALQITEAGRTWAQQNAHYKAYLAGTGVIALHPDTPSIHQLGNAIDSDEAQKHLSLMAEHGWGRTVYRNGVLVEPWHFEYVPANDKHRNQSAGSASKPTTNTPEGEEGDEEMSKNILYRTSDTTAKIRAAVVNDVSGMWIEFTADDAGPLNNHAKAFGTGDAITCSPSMFSAAREAAAKVRSGRD